MSAIKKTLEYLGFVEEDDEPQTPERRNREVVETYDEPERAKEPAPVDERPPATAPR